MNSMSNSILRRLNRGSSLEDTNFIGNGWSQGRTYEELQKMQATDPGIGLVLEWFKSGKRPFGKIVCSASPEVRQYWNYWQSLEIQNGLLFKRFYKLDGTNLYLQFLVPKVMRKEIMYQMHNTKLSGHLGKKKTLQKILQHYFWFEVNIDVTQWIRQCDSCSANKKTNKTPKAPLGDMRVGAPLDRLSTDVLGPLPLTPRGNRFIIVVAIPEDTPLKVTHPSLTYGNHQI